ncbi:MAG: urea ABC transporter permease subunit UrtB [Cellvibrionales bacterium]|nr:urea ABC transporter permease subunit UrtB [Cellvibrionales bacterium]
MVEETHNFWRVIPVTDSFILGAPIKVTDSEVFKTQYKKPYKKIRINNRLRSQIRLLLAKRGLVNSDPSIRIEAVNTLIKKPDTTLYAVIQERLANEKNADILEKLRLLNAMLALNHPTSKRFESSIEHLSKSLEPSSLTSLNQFLEKHPSHKQALAAVKAIEEKKHLYSLLENGFFGLSMGSVLVLAAIGLAITFGVMGVINMAHGELIMIGAYTTFVIQQLMPQFIGISIIVAIPAAFVVAALVGITMERLVIQYLKGRPLETLLATFGISLLLQQTVRSIFSPLNRTVVTPDWLSGVFTINPVFGLTINRLAIIFFCLVLFGLLWWWMRRSRLGLQVRAVSQNRSMAEALGVNADRVDMLTFGLGAGIAGVAGVALSLISNVGPNMGQGYIIDSFIVVVFGGVGNLFGTLLAGLSLGVANKWLEPFAGAVLAKILLLIFIILFIQKRPQGLFPAKGRAQEMAQ